MEHVQRVCPRCGEPAGEYRFCESCRSQIAGTQAGETRYPATQALRDVLRLEEALAAASKGISDRIAARTAGPPVQVDEDLPPAAAADAGAPTVEIATLPTSIADRAVEAVAPSRAVARLEDVLTVAPPKPAASVAPPMPVAPAPAVEAVAAEPVTPAAPVVEAATTPAPVEEVAITPAPVEEPSFLTAPAKREGFWFDYMPAPEPAEVADEAPEDEHVPEAVAPELEPEQVAVESHGGERTRLVGALCLIALLGLIFLLTGRDPRRAR